ncbi:MAG TPA: Hsp20/alpha crystallin family protein [Pirellulales bacterium]|nr:Hsp20/alpha crystallin family protein [Pirellulales bacterium]
MTDIVRNMLESLLMPTSVERQRADWRPAADVYSTRRGWLVKFDLAGVRPQEIEVLVRGQRLTVRGVRRDCALDEGCRYHSLEISYNRFERTLELPCNLEAARLSTDYRDGMLLVHLQLESDEG